MFDIGKANAGLKEASVHACKITQFRTYKGGDTVGKSRQEP